jgi:NitT/TauT family transport system substrate-binding protein
MTVTPVEQAQRPQRPLGSLGLCALAVAVGGSFLISSTSSCSSSEQKLQTSVVYYLDRTMSAPEAGAIIALKKGYFESEGLKVRIVEGAIDRQPAVSVSDNSIAIGVAGVFEFLKTRAAGRTLVAFASAYTRNPIVFYVRHDSNMRSVADFANKVVAYEAGHPTAIVFDALLAKNHVSKSTIKPVAGLRTVSALASRAIDILPGYVGRESYLLNQMGVSFDQISPDAFSLHLPGSVYLTDEETLRSSPETVQKFLRALIRGWNTAYRKDGSDLSTIAEALGLSDVNTVSELLDQQRPLLRPSGRRFAELDPIDMKDALAVLVQQRLVPSDFSLTNALNIDILRDTYLTEQKSFFAN